MGIFQEETGNGWEEKNNQEYINSWFNDRKNQIYCGNGKVSHIGCAPQYTTWL